MIYGIIGFLLGVVVTFILEVLGIRHAVLSNRNKRSVKHQSLNEASNSNNGSNGK